MGAGALIVVGILIVSLVAVGWWGYKIGKSEHDAR